MILKRETYRARDEKPEGSDRKRKGTGNARCGRLSSFGVQRRSQKGETLNLHPNARCSFFLLVNRGFLASRSHRCIVLATIGQIFSEKNVKRRIQRCRRHVLVSQSSRRLRDYALGETHA